MARILHTHGMTIVVYPNLRAKEWMGKCECKCMRARVSFTVCIVLDRVHALFLPITFW